MITGLPSLGGLRAFEAAARHVSVKLAAEELNVTPGAVSLQIKELERTLGIQLFVRRPRRLELTPQGEEYAAALRSAFRIMREATASIAARSRQAVVTISCTPSFAHQWLVPRLTRFEKRCPGIEVRISATNRMVDFARDEVDLAVRHGFGRYNGLTSERLIDDELVPVCSPLLLLSEPPVISPIDLQSFVLLHDEHRHDWQLWLQAAGACEVDASGGVVFTDCNGVIEAAKVGRGIALVRRSLVERELAEGSLLTPMPGVLASDLAYHLVYPGAALTRPFVSSFRAWLLLEASRQPDSVVLR